MKARDATRWALCFAAVICFHAAGAAALMAHWSTDADPVTNAPVITVELAPIAVAPQTRPTEAPPGPQQADAAAQPQPQEQPKAPAIEAAPAKEAELPMLPPPKPPERPKHKKPERKQASLASAPSTAERESRRAAAPAPGAESHDPSALPNWKSALVARLERYKRYPSEARARGEYGVAQLAFSVDRGGNAHRARILRSSGSRLLDEATLSLLARAQPLPPPPPEMHGAEIAIVVPIRYSIR